MWWLTFLGGDVVIIEATSLAHARLLAALNKLGRASHFAQGHSISPELAALPERFSQTDTLANGDRAVAQTA
jgi:hypothetical protein